MGILSLIAGGFLLNIVIYIVSRNIKSLKEKAVKITLISAIVVGMAVQIVHAMVAEVAVLSQILKKKDDGLKLGADNYYATSDSQTFQKLAGSFDLIINTVSAKINLDAYLGLLTLDGTLVNVGAPAEPLLLSVINLKGKIARINQNLDVIVALK